MKDGIMEISKIKNSVCYELDEIFKYLSYQKRF